MTRIVLADDHPFMRAGVEAVLGANGMEVVAAVENGNAALEAVRSLDPDVVILDVRMPERDGVSTLAELRSQGDRRPVILLAAELEDPALQGAMAAGVNGIVFKAGAETMLASAIVDVLAGSQFIDAETRSRAEAIATRVPRPLPRDVLSSRELEIAAAVTEGLRNREIAARVGMTEGSIKVYLHRIYEKLGIESRTELAVTMLEQGRSVQ